MFLLSALKPYMADLKPRIEKILENSKDKKGKFSKDGAALKKAWDQLLKNIDKPCTVRKVKDDQAAAKAG